MGVGGSICLETASARARSGGAGGGTGGAHREVLIDSAVHIPEHSARLDPRRPVGVGVATRARDDLRRAVRREDARRAELMRDDL